MRALEQCVQRLAALNRLSIAGCAHLVVALVAGITVIVCAGVFWRYALNDALAWSEESAKFLMVWLVFIGAPIALARGGHAAIDALPEALPPRAGQLVYACAYAVVIAFVLVLIDQGTRFAWNARVQHTPTTGISMAYVFAAMPVGGVLMLLIAAEHMLRSVVGVAHPPARSAGAAPEQPQ